MLYQSHAPAPPLDKFVEYFWALCDAPPHAHERIVASGTLELVVNLDENQFRVYDPDDLVHPRCFSGAMVSGVYRSPFVIDTREHAAIVGVHFKPGGALPFLGAPPGELADIHVDLDCLWKQHGSRLREMLCAARDTEQRFEILARTLRMMLRPPRERYHAVRYAMRRLERGVSVGEVSVRLGLSRRRLIEVFTADVGMTPKLFARVRRFQRAFDAAQRELRSWSELAFECGYFDQSHLIRDFVAFAGEPPAEIARRRAVTVKEHHIALTSAGDGQIHPIQLRAPPP
jgi:AraC-like DNA-binding protein